MWMMDMRAAEFSFVPDDAALTARVVPRRLGGWLVDAVIQGVLLAVLHAVLWVLGYLTLGLGWFLLSGLWVVPVVYVFVFVASPGQVTPGQALAGLRVVRDDDLGRPTPAQALVYAVGYAVTMALSGLWLAAAFFTRRARCLHDIAAGVAVLRSDALPSPAEGALNRGAPGGWAVR
jgi:uncharacterized RDD family membrane protein YckC